MDFYHIAVVLCAYLIFEQPDLGTSIIVLISGLIPIYLAGLPYKIILSYLVAVGILSPYVWSNLLDYQKQRVLTYFDSNVDPLGDGWNIAQSQTAIGSGGVFGKGYLQGSQSQLNFIPESHSDFIFSVIGEEFGLIGIFILFLYTDSLYGEYLVLDLKHSPTLKGWFAHHWGLYFSFYSYQCLYGYWFNTCCRSASPSYQSRRHFDSSAFTSFWSYSFY